jgi:hypothetical protein
VSDSRSTSSSTRAWSRLINPPIPTSIVTTIIQRVSAIGPGSTRRSAIA